VARSKQPRRPAIHGSLVPFALLPGGEPVVFLAPDELHIKARSCQAALRLALRL
jgi:hypothetical protein